MWLRALESTADGTTTIRHTDHVTTHYMIYYPFYSIPLACAECDDSLPFSEASSILARYILFSCHSSPPTILPSSLNSSCHLFHGLPLGLVDSKFMYTTLFGILFPSILCTCPNQHNLCSLIVSVMVGFFKNCVNFFIS
jgi:hypothetical protein